MSTACPASYNRPVSATALASHRRRGLQLYVSSASRWALCESCCMCRSLSPYAVPLLGERRRYTDPGCHSQAACDLARRPPHLRPATAPRRTALSARREDQMSNDFRPAAGRSVARRRDTLLSVVRRGEDQDEPASCESRSSCCASPAGERPAPVSVGAPGSRPQSCGRDPDSRAGYREGPSQRRNRRLWVLLSCPSPSSRRLVEDLPMRPAWFGFVLSMVAACRS